MKGNLFSYPEAEEQYPTQWSEQRAVLMPLMANPDPRLQAVLSDPSNLGLLKRLIGLDELVIPDDESRAKQYREIAQMLEEQPIIVPNNQSGSEVRPYATANTPSSPVGATFSSPADASVEAGLQSRPGEAEASPLRSAETILPSIVRDEFADNHAVELDACKRWFSSDAGQVAKIEDPAGYANVRAHAQMHQEFLRKQQMQNAAMAQAVQPQPPRKK